MKILRQIAVLLILVLIITPLIRGKNFVFTGNVFTDNLIEIGILIVIIIILLIPEKRKINTCGHNNWGPVHEGFQYCRACGTAKPAPKNICVEHIDEVIEKLEVLQAENVISEIIFINRCTNCGRIEEVRVNCSKEIKK